VDAVAELAGEVCLALLAQNVLQLLRAEGEQRALRALARAVAAVFDGRRLQDLEVKIGKHRAQEVCRIGIVAELICHAGRGVDAALDLGDGILARAGEELNEIAAGGEHAAVAVDQHAEAAGRGDLLGLDEVGSQILGDLAAEQVDRADVGLLEPEVLDNGQGAAVADGAADVQLTVCAQGKLHGGVLHIAAHVALGVGDGEDGAERAVALDLERNALTAALEGVAHHGDAGERTAERCGSDGAGVVDLAGALGQTARVDRDSVDKAIFRDGADQTVLLCFHIWFLTF